MASPVYIFIIKPLLGGLVLCVCVCVLYGKWIVLLALDVEHMVRTVGGKQMKKKKGRGRLARNS